MEQVSEVGGGEVVKGFEGEEEQFIVNAVRDGEPVKVLADGGYVVVRMDLSEESDSRILDVLEFESFEGGTEENAVTEV